MRRSVVAGLLILPIAAHAQGVQVPALGATADSHATPTEASATASATTSTPLVSSSPPPSNGPVPQGWPPEPKLPQPSVTLNVREGHALALSQRWKEHRGDMPTPGPDGKVRFLFGATIPTVICSPLNACAIEFQAGEIITSEPTIGDAVRWKTAPRTAGSGASMVTLLVVKPTEPGLVSSMIVTTNKRFYTIKLVSTVSRWVAITAFNYSDDSSSAWQAYSATANRSSASAGASSGNLVDQNFVLSGDNPPWRPVRVTTDGYKTYIEFAPGSMRSQTPTLVGLVHKGWFEADETQIINYRQWGNQIVADQVLTKAKLTLGVGGSETKVVITRKAQ